MIYKGYFDGSSKGNPGPSQSAWIIKDCNDKEYARDVIKSTEDRTNNYAEYVALIKLMQYILNQKDIIKIDIYGDSKLVIQQTQNIWKCNAKNIKSLWIISGRLFQKLNEEKIVTLNWIPRDQNNEADNLAQKGTL